MDYFVSFTPWVGLSNQSRIRGFLHGLATHALGIGTIALVTKINEALITTLVKKVL